MRCADFRSSRCTLREEGWAAEWAQLWGRYPQLEQLKELMNELGRKYPHWGLALYWIYVQPWDAFERTRRETWAREGVLLRESVDLNRLQLVFPGKPDDATRALLRSHGFRWEPSAGAWQRQLDNGARYAADGAPAPRR